VTVGEDDLAGDLADAEESLAVAVAQLAELRHPSVRHGAGWERAHVHAEHCAAAVLAARQRLDEYRRHGTTRRADRLMGGAA